VAEKHPAESPDTKVICRDLVAAALPHVTRATLPTVHRPALELAALDRPARCARAESDAVLGEFMAADAVVIAAAMYNFAVPSQLKSWV
jgi:FMN-dependent NADH-azoreductase